MSLPCCVAHGDKVALETRKAGEMYERLSKFMFKVNFKIIMSVYLLPNIEKSIHKCIQAHSFCLLKK